MSKRPPPVSPTIVCTAYGPTRRKDERAGTRSAGDAFGAADATGLTFRCTTRVRLSSSWTPVQPLPRRAVENSRMVNSSDSAVYTTPRNRRSPRGAHEVNDGGHMEHRGTQANAQPPPIIGLGRHAQAHEPLAQRGAPAAFQDEEVDHRREPRPRRKSEQRGRAADPSVTPTIQAEDMSSQITIETIAESAIHAMRRAPSGEGDFIRGPVRPQEIRQLGVRLRSSGGSLREAAQHDGRESARNVTPKHTRRWRLLGSDLRDELTEVRRVERRPSRQEVVERRADGVDVGADVERLAS